jgi:hypothetical protein
MRGIRPDIVANDTTHASARMFLEAKTAALRPSNYGTGFAANGDTWMEARARKAVVERDMAAKKLDDVVFPNAQPPPMATQLQNLGAGSRPLSLVLSASTTTRLTEQPGEPPRCQGGPRG